MQTFAIAFYMLTAIHTPLKVEVISAPSFDSCMLEAQIRVSKNVLAGTNEGLTATCTPL